MLSLKTINKNKDIIHFDYENLAGAYDKDKSKVTSTLLFPLKCTIVFSTQTDLPP